MSQKEVAKFLGVKPSMVSRYENGVVPLPYARATALAELYKIPVTDFLIEYPSDSNPAIVPKRIVLEQTIPNGSIIDLYRRLVILAAGGCCELCKQPAPFNDLEGRPYLLVHEVNGDGIWTEKEPQTQNLVALCPNCFARVVVRRDEADMKKIKEVAAKHDF